MTDVSQDGADPDPDGDGDSGDNGVPTPILLPVNVVEIPALSTWGLLALGSLLAAFSLLRLLLSQG